jgi:hypothetical protein
MQILKNRSKISAITFVLMLTITALLVTVLVTVNAQNTESWRSFIYCSVSPNVVGVGQQVIIIAWTADMPPEIGEELGLLPSPTGRAGWYDMTVTVTRPDGTKETLEYGYSDPIGANWIAYTPNEAGTYIAQANFPGTWKNGTHYIFPNPPYEVNRYYEPDVSDPVEFIVQEEPIQAWQESPLPTGYWTRPISAASRDWHALTGNWLGGAANVWPPGASGGTTDRFVYSTGPESAHILWTKPLYIGGLMDEYFDNIGFQTGHYQGLSFSPIILDGKIHYASRYTAHWDKGWTTVDLYTGETLFLDYNATAPSFGQIYNYESPNQHGGFAYLWRTSNVELPENVTRLKNGGFGMPDIEETVTNLHSRPGTQTWEMIDAHTGNRVCYIANVSAAGTAVYGKDGSILRYNIVNLGTGANPNYYLQVWNSTSMITMFTGDEGTWRWQWRPQWGGHGNWGYRWRENVDAFHDGDLGFSLNVSVPALQGRILAVREGEFVIGGTTGINDETGITPGVMWKLSLETGQEGTLLWNRTFTPPSSANRETVSMTGVYPEYGMFLFESTRKLQRFGYSLDTMQQVWESEPELQMNYYGMMANVYEGLLLASGWAGELRAYNIATGEIVWSYEAKNVGFESPYGNYPINIFAIADGKIYTLTGEHSIGQPIMRGPNLRCINATDGTEIWKVLNFGANGGSSLRGMYMWMAEGKIVGLNYLDNQIYCFGKGNSATTVEAPKTAVPLGSSVMITGTVTDDTSTGRRNTNDEIDFTLKGTPAISDEDMGAWMEYMFMQQEYPKDAKGVTVKLTAIDPNGNFQDIGEVTSDISGTFGKSWVPPVPGEYHLTATFEGSASYGSSTATTYFVVDPAPSAAQPIEPAPTEPEPTEPEPTEPEPTEPEPTEPEPAEPAEAPLFSTTDLAIIAAVAVAAVIGIAAYWQLRKRK